MRLSNYHTHTVYCDGRDTPEELVLEALRLGCPELGFSEHSWLPGEDWTMDPEETPEDFSPGDNTAEPLYGPPDVDK